MVLGIGALGIDPADHAAFLALNEIIPAGGVLNLPRPLEDLEYPVRFVRHGWTLAILSAKINPMIWLPHPPVCVIDWAKPGKNR